MVLAHAKRVEPDRVGVYDLLDEGVQPDGCALLLPGGVIRRGETIDANLHLTTPKRGSIAAYREFRTRILEVHWRKVLTTG